jgi:uncharacterized protein with HEPN domain
MSRRGDRERLADMLDAIQRATSYIADMSYEDFLGDLSVAQTLLQSWRKAWKQNLVCTAFS